MKTLAISASPRKKGNSDLLLDAAIESAIAKGSDVLKIYISDMNIKACLGCLRCNILGHCAIKGDDWPDFAEKFINSDAILISAPVYFWYVPGTFKVIVDRFRSLIKVTMGPEHITCTPRDWKPKNFGFILTQGEPTGNDFEPALQMLRTFAGKMSRGGKITGEVIAKGPALKGQVDMKRDRLQDLFSKVGMPTDEDFIETTCRLYQSYFKAARELGARLVSS